MISRISAFARRVRRWFSRSEWVIRFLRLPTSKHTAAHFGLVLIQIDGLSFRETKLGLKSGRLPFLNFLLRREGYVRHPLYSGLPSSTPSVQAEFFYGAKAALPAFGFKDIHKGRVVEMLEKEAAREAEGFLRKEAKGLLAGGSSYCNIFTGGAKEPHFCIADLGLSHLLWKVANPLVFPLLFLLYLDVIVRTLLLLGTELLLACVDAVRGILAGRWISIELSYIFTRVGVCVLLRELAVLGAQIDIARGLPIIHLNLLGYDEQAHHRGPDSRFARWSLRGIDYSVERLWKAAHRSVRRSYDVWIYSDHGQEKSSGYAKSRGESLADAVSRIFGVPADSDYRNGGGSKFQLLRVLFPTAHTKGEVRGDHISVAAMGPLGHVYFSKAVSPEEKERLALELVGAGIPAVCAVVRPGQVACWTEKGNCTLPEEAEKFFGWGHPFLPEIARDFVDLCHHPDSGQFILSGWKRNGQTVTFPIESGSHGGPGIQETRAFALLPPDAPLEIKEYLRPSDLRNSALAALGRPRDPNWIHVQPVLTPKTFRVLTYNVHSCLGMDGKLSPERIARVIARQQPDAVALQELDVLCNRTGCADQAELIAGMLSMQFHFHAARAVGNGKFGNAVLSRRPMRLVRMDPLPRLSRGAGENRGAVWVELEIGNRKVHLFNSHLSLWPRERLLQVETLLGPEWAKRARNGDPVVLCGDFNAWPHTEVYRRITRDFLDAQICLQIQNPSRTYLGRYPLTRIDHIFVTPDLKVVSVKAPRTELDILASDHLPLVAELALE